MSQCLEELEAKLGKHGAECEERAAAAKAAAAEQQSAAVGSSSGAASTSGGNTNALAAMMALREAQSRASVANEAALAAEKEKDAAEAEVERLHSVLEPKRPRTEAAAAAATAADEDGPTASMDDWDLAVHRREATRVRNRRAKEIGSCESALKVCACVHAHAHTHAHAHARARTR